MQNRRIIPGKSTITVERKAMAKHYSFPKSRPLSPSWLEGQLDSEITQLK
jgi:hypothetical protein